MRQPGVEPARRHCPGPQLGHRGRRGASANGAAGERHLKRDGQERLDRRPATLNLVVDGPPAGLRLGGDSPLRVAAWEGVIAGSRGAWDHGRGKPPEPQLHPRQPAPSICLRFTIKCLCGRPPSRKTMNLVCAIRSLALICPAFWSCPSMRCNFGCGPGPSGQAASGVIWSVEPSSSWGVSSSAMPSICMYRCWSCQSSFCSSSTAPTRRVMLSSLGKMACHVGAPLDLLLYPGRFGQLVMIVSLPARCATARCPSRRQPSLRALGGAGLRMGYGREPRGASLFAASGPGHVAGAPKKWSALASTPSPRGPLTAASSEAADLAQWDVS